MRPGKEWGRARATERREASHPSPSSSISPSAFQTSPTCPTSRSPSRRGPSPRSGPPSSAARPPRSRATAPRRCPPSRACATPSRSLTPRCPPSNATTRPRWKMPRSERAERPRQVPPRATSVTRPCTSRRLRSRRVSLGRRGQPLPGLERYALPRTMSAQEDVA
ncbi:hypothetical protein DMC30DRAFT_399306 [Rhodotorula diobovata]|uniref:Uncharacterized protein n=1 Tax=Rhodotorula diobovata TaxID=5288 RepID=A0A5C5FSL2_9BASI|nr:hypothetical protein DMC30DRAFT_399306 [Rhodotorula diobovata]